LIAEKHLDSLLLGFLSNRDAATTTSSTATLNSGALSQRGKTAWVSTAQPLPTLMVRVGDGYLVMYGVEPTLLPTWLKPTLESVLPLLKLEPGWDSYGGRPIDRRVVTTAIEVLSAVMEQHSPAPFAVPTSAGGVQFEWHRGGIDLELVFDPGQALFDFESADGEEIQGNAIQQTQRLAQLISRLPK
jgi:hypothetical protein